MDQLLLDRLLGDPSLFTPTGGHHAIEIFLPRSSTATKPDPQVRETVLAEKQLAGWCREEPKRDGDGSLFRLLVCSPRVLDRDIWPLPVTSSTLASMLASQEIPALFPRAICRHIPLATSFESLDGSNDKFGILLRTNLSHTWQYSLALVQDPASSTTTGIIFGLRSNEMEEVLQIVRHMAIYVASCPAVLPCLLMDRGLDELVKDAEERRKGLTQIRIETGSQGFHQASLMKTNDQWELDRDDLDLDVLMQKLTSLSDACSGISAVCRMQFNFIDVVSSFFHRDARLEKSPDSSSSRYARQQLRFFGQFLHGVESKVTYTKSSVQDQVQTIYTLISQRDSRNHMALAKTTRRLAELSRKDSTDMRVISAVTLVFLPATFMSTFFSASFFNFQPRPEVDPSEHVSRWIWLYCVVTTVLTLVVLASWWYFSRRQHVKANVAFRRESELKRQATMEVGKFNGGIGDGAAIKMPDESSGGIPGQQLRGRMEDFRPYLGGSIAEGMFARKVTLPPDLSGGPSRVETWNISPTATGLR
ncbi:hypothetical protein B0H63DRAFT_74056 [Podospora didyma]|uniref:Uncharacterized protein n=1 Tax=Podospora didyma TaxID=330526 RepID=A0AAE0N2G4_9PEZI|nr:hypothetical protein B0H63DRAFT_74056 [Podospora didyma]